MLLWNYKTTGDRSRFLNCPRLPPTLKVQNGSFIANNRIINIHNQLLSIAAYVRHSNPYGDKRLPLLSVIFRIKLVPYIRPQGQDSLRPLSINSSVYAEKGAGNPAPFVHPLRLGISKSISVIFSTEQGNSSCLPSYLIAWMAHSCTYGPTYPRKYLPTSITLKSKLR